MVQNFNSNETVPRRFIECLLDVVKMRHEKLDPRDVTLDKIILINYFSYLYLPYKLYCNRTEFWKIDAIREKKESLEDIDGLYCGSAFAFFDMDFETAGRKFLIAREREQECKGGLVDLACEEDFVNRDLKYLFKKVNEYLNEDVAQSKNRFEQKTYSSSLFGAI